MKDRKHKVGDKVTITDQGSDHCHKTGVVKNTGPAREEHPGDVWMVQLDGDSSLTPFHCEQLEPCDQGQGQEGGQQGTVRPHGHSSHSNSPQAGVSPHTGTQAPSPQPSPQPPPSPSPSPGEGSGSSSTPAPAPTGPQRPGPSDTGPLPTPSHGQPHGGPGPGVPPKPSRKGDQGKNSSGEHGK